MYSGGRLLARTIQSRTQLKFLKYCLGGNTFFRNILGKRVYQCIEKIIEDLFKGYCGKEHIFPDLAVRPLADASQGISDQGWNDGGDGGYGSYDGGNGGGYNRGGYDDGGRSGYNGGSGSSQDNGGYKQTKQQNDAAGGKMKMAKGMKPKGLGDPDCDDGDKSLTKGKTGSLGDDSAIKGNKLI